LSLNASSFSASEASTGGLIGNNDGQRVAGAEKNSSPDAPSRSTRWRRREAITDEALAAFRRVYPRIFADYQMHIDKLKKQKKSLADFRECGPYSRSQAAGEEITKEDIFFYVYGLLHSPEYRQRFAENLKKELPRIPFARDFLAFSLTGRKLAQLHLEYETGPSYPLDERYISDDPQLRRDPGRLTKMRWGKSVSGDDGKKSVLEDRSVLVYNENLTLRGIPARAHDYIVNGRSPLEWLIYMYQVKTDKDSGIVSDPNLYSDNPRYIVDLIKRVTYVSVETVKLVEALPPLEEITPADGVMPIEWTRDMPTGNDSNKE
ncbi:hypothetical protein IJT17_05015, partial [bacterium]|nr:hypothetical protein [bacterium]